MNPAAAENCKNMEAFLRSSKLRAKSNGSAEESILSAGYYAKKNGKPMYIYLGNSYGSRVWRVTFDQDEATNRINNYAGLVYTVSPALSVSCNA